MILHLLRCLRPKQWTKNLLLFAGVVFSRQWGEPLALRNAALGFAVFCALAGVVYITNDILDAEKDRQHPRKRLRPIASGAVGAGAAGAFGAMLLVGALAVSFLVLPLPFALSALIYFALSSAYSFRLKNVVVLDILTLAMGFVIRAIAGIEAIKVGGREVEVTGYFILTTLFLALFLAICKRRNELVVLGEDAGHHREVLREYSTEYLDILLTVATGCVLFSYALWTTQGKFAKVSADGPGQSGTYAMVFTMPFVIYGIFRYLWLVVQRDEGGAPEALLVEDPPLLVTVLLWVATTVGVLAWTR